MFIFAKIRLPSEHGILRANVNKMPFFVPKTKHFIDNIYIYIYIYIYCAVYIKLKILCLLTADRENMYRWREKV